MVDGSQLKSTSTRSKSWAWGIIKDAVVKVYAAGRSSCASSQTLLKLIATQALPLELPALNWPWYKQGNTVGQIRRRLTELCRPRISRTKAADPTAEELKKAA